MSPLFLSSAELPPKTAAVVAERGGLYVSRPLDLSRPRVAVVGARACSEDAFAFTVRLGAALARRGVDVVSGGAIGIDAAAHQGALSALTPERRIGCGRTWMVLGSALDHPGKDNDPEMRAQVAKHGVLISQFPNGTPAPRSAHRMRNRTLISLCQAVVIVQAGAASGSRNAATHAHQLSVPCLVLAGPAWDRRFGGSRDIVERGQGRWVHSEAELFDRLRLALRLPAAQRTSTKQAELFASSSTVVSASRATKPANFRAFEASPLGTALFQCLENSPQHLDQLAEHTGHKTDELMEVLLTLSLEDVVREEPPGFWALRPSTPPALP